MTKKKKPLSISLVIILLLMLCSSCGRKPAENRTPDSSDPVSSDLNFSHEDPTTMNAINYEYTPTKNKTITVDASTARTASNKTYDGLGMVSANNSSRLLLDYKAEHPEVYRELIEYMFGEKGLHLSLIKIEMGADVDSSSGTEPAVKRSADEKADVTRGAGYQLAADALTVNPELMIDLLPWGLPNWVAKAEDVNEATYQWYKQTIDALFDTYGIRVTHITVTQNEKTYKPELIKYISNALKSETDTRYDYSAIQIVAGEGVGVWNIASSMLKDEDLMNAIDVVSAHYTSFTSDQAKQLQDDYGKKLWFSEGCSPMSSSADVMHYDGTGTGMTDINGVLDIAVRITQAITEGMTMYEFQPVISSYYDGVTYYPKQLITANEPWNGSYSLDTGFYMAMHFNQFMDRDWCFIGSACFGDGKAGGDGHALVDSTYNYITALSPDGQDFTQVFVNQSAETIQYEIHTKDLPDSTLYAWQSKAPDAEDSNYFAHFLEKLGIVTPTDNTYVITVLPYSMMTLSTLDVTMDSSIYEAAKGSSDLLSIDYSDDFEYADYPEDYLSSRGYAPRFATDQGGAFEIAEENGNHILLQQITYANKPSEWARTSNPTTNLGEDRWHNYGVSARVRLADTKTKEENENYVGLGLRYILADSNESGYWVKLTETGMVQLMKDNAPLAEAALDSFDPHSWHTLKITAKDSSLTASVNDLEVITYTDSNGSIHSGRIALYSEYELNAFDDLKTFAVDDETYITRFDNLSSVFSYSAGNNVDDQNGWYHATMSSFKNFARTISAGTKGDTVTVTAEGENFAFIGIAKNATIAVTIDGKKIPISISCPQTENRKCFYTTGPLSEGMHTITLEIMDGELGIDAVEIVTVSR